MPNQPTMNTEAWGFSIDTFMSDSSWISKTPASDAAQPWWVLELLIGEFARCASNSEGHAFRGATAIELQWRGGIVTFEQRNSCLHFGTKTQCYSGLRMDFAHAGALEKVTGLGHAWCLWLDVESNDDRDSAPFSSRGSLLYWKCTFSDPQNQTAYA